MVALPAPDLTEEVQVLDELALGLPWVTIVWNDPVNLMSYVSYVFRSYFGFSAAEADRRMLQVHHEGRAIVANGTREEMERHVEAMHEFGLWATLDRAGE
jgi:ATP-dependent Clp protease adaptor protein ClpS